MTLIVAGYTGVTLWKKKNYDRIFFVGDTLLSAEGRTDARERLIEIFKKVRRIPVKIWTPHFDTDGHFSRYLESFSSSCVIAYAGSTLTFSHMLNGIQEHLGQLRYTFNDGQYKIVKHCSSEAIQKNYAVTWADDIVFESRNLPSLAADFQMEVISHVIRRALKDVSAHRLLDQNSFRSISCQLAVALYCWDARKPVLYHVEVVLTDEFPKYATLKYRRLGEQETVVLGASLQREVEELMREVRKAPESPAKKTEIGAQPDRGTDELKAAKALVRKEILADQEGDRNYVGGMIDCWEFSDRGHTEQWYELPEVLNSEEGLVISPDE